MIKPIATIFAVLILAPWVIVAIGIAVSNLDIGSTLYALLSGIPPTIGVLMVVAAAFFGVVGAILIQLARWYFHLNRPWTN
jgi:hypothetical protein